MTDFGDQLNQYLSGSSNKCPHPLNKVFDIGGYKDVCCLCGKTVFAIAFHEVDPTPTMTRATKADIDRIWRKLWGDATVLYLLGRFDTESGEYLDLTQNESK